MHITKLFIFAGAVVVGLICEHPLARAQPASEPASTESSPAPTKDEPASTDDDSSSENDSILVDEPNNPWSQGVSTEDRRAAIALLREGTRLYLIPLYAKAAEQYAAGLRKWKHPGIYYNLALTQLNLGKESDALDSLEHALQYGEKGLGPKRFREAQKQLADVKRSLGRLRVTCRIPGAEVTLDGVTLFIGPGSYEGWVKAKSHEVTAKKTGYLSEARRVTVASEQRQDIDLKLITLDEAADASRRWAVWKPWAVVAAGGVVAVAGGGLHARSARNFNKYDDEFRLLPCASEPPEAPSGCTPMDIGSKLNRKLKRAELQQNVAVGGYIVGGALLTVGMVFLYLNRPQLLEQRESTSLIKTIAITPILGSNEVGISVVVSP